MKRLILSWSAIGLFSLYVAYQSYQEKQPALAKLTHREQMIKYKNQQLLRYQAINEQLLKDKLKAENASVEFKRQLKHELKKNHGLMSLFLYISRTNCIIGYRRYVSLLSRTVMGIIDSKPLFSSNLSLFALVAKIIHLAVLYIQENINIARAADDVD